LRYGFDAGRADLAAYAYAAVLDPGPAPEGLRAPAAAAASGLQLVHAGSALWCGRGEAQGGMGSGALALDGDGAISRFDGVEGYTEVELVVDPAAETLSLRVSQGDRTVGGALGLGGAPQSVAALRLIAVPLKGDDTFPEWPFEFVIVRPLVATEPKASVGPETQGPFF
jgi:hypothetical protein